MKILRNLTIICLITFSSSLVAQVAINTTGSAPAASAMLDITSTDKGILIPRVVSTASVSSPAFGLMVIQTSDGILYLYNGTAWFPINTQWRTSGSNIYYTAGYIGVGTSVPNEPITIQTNDATVYNASDNTAQQGLGANLSIRNSNGTTGSFSQLTLHTSSSAGRGLARIAAIDAGSNNTHLVFVNEQSGITKERMRITNTGFIGLETSSPTSTLHVAGSFATNFATKGSNYTATATDQTINVTASGVTITLPTAVGISGRIYTIKLTASGTATVATTSSQNIDNATTYSLSSQYKYVTVISNGTDWSIIGQN